MHRAVHCSAVQCYALMCIALQCLCCVLQCCVSQCLRHGSAYYHHPSLASTVQLDMVQVYPYGRVHKNEREDHKPAIILTIEKSTLVCNLLTHLSNPFLFASNLPISALLLKHISISFSTNSSTFSISQRMRLHSALMLLYCRQLLLISLPFKGSIIFSRLLNKIWSLISYLCWPDSLSTKQLVSWLRVIILSWF